MIRLFLRIAPLLGVTILGAGALTACSDGVMIEKIESTGYTGDFYVQSTAAGGVNAVLVRNNPYSDADVLAALRERYQGDQYRFALGQTPEGWNGYTVTIVFGDTPANIQNPCQPQPPVRLAPGEMSAVAGYCYGPKAVSEAVGRVPSGVSGPSDPRFKALIGDLVGEIFINRPIHGYGHAGSTTVP